MALIRNKEAYFRQLHDYIFNQFSIMCGEKINYDILDTEKTIRNKLITLRQKQFEMRKGNIWQHAIGTWRGFKDLGIGHETGLDILSDTRKIAIELKSRTNTDNASSKKSNLDKLAKFKSEHPDYDVIYANINDDTQEKTITGSDTIFTHNGQIIRKIVGLPLLHFIFGVSTDEVITFLKSSIEKYGTIE